MICRLDPARRASPAVMPANVRGDDGFYCAAGSAPPTDDRTLSLTLPTLLWTITNNPWGRPGMAGAAPDNLRISVRGAVAMVELDRAAKRNALDNATIRALENFFATPPEGVRAAVLHGAHALGRRREEVLQRADG